MYKTLCLALLLTASAAYALTAEESQTLRQAAITAGIARRGYLRGLASAKGCTIAPVAPPQPAKKKK